MRVRAAAVIGCLLFVLIPGPSRASHGREPHLPMRDRGGRTGPARSCDGVLLTTVERTRPVLWYLRMGASPKRAMTLPAGVTVNAAAVAPNGRTVAVEVERPTDGDASMSAFSRMRSPVSTALRILVVDLPVRGRRDARARLAGSSPSWSRDGRRLAFERGGALLVTSSAAWRKAEVVGWGEDPSWSPRGNALAFVHDGVLHVATLSSSTRLADGTKVDSVPVWSPDGRSIVFGRRERRGGWEDLWIVDARGGTPSRLTHYNRYNGARFATWSPDGRRIAFTMGNSEAWGVRIVDVTTRRIVTPAHPVARGLGPFTAAGAWTSPRSLLYEAGMERRSLWHLTIARRAVPLVQRSAGLRVVATGLCGAPPRR